MNKNDVLAEITRNGLSQEKVADSLEVSRVTLARKLNGENQFTLSELRKLVDILNLTDERVMAIFFN